MHGSRCNTRATESVRLIAKRDWCSARGAAQSIKHHLPFKIHTGYYAGEGSMRVDRIQPGRLCEMLIQYPRAKCVLMHIAYPYSDELIAMAKHFSNVYVDLCWAWSMGPYSSCDFLRKMIHAVPANKLFAFGGDTKYPNQSRALSIQARKWIHHARRQEIDDGYFNEAQAIQFASKCMYDNQHACFAIADTRKNIKTRMR